ncbi:hypothetical protein ACFLUO_06140 [Chloroflexota bacterium]
MADEVVCPEAEFHLTEAKYNSRLWEPIIEIIRTLSGGLQLRPYKNILGLQVKDAARQFLSIEPEERERWSVAFMSDPNCKYSDRIQDVLGGKVRMYVHTPLTSVDIEHERQSKTGFVEQEQKILEEYGRKPLIWSELLLDSKKGVIDGFMGKLAEKSIYEKLEGNYPLEDKLIAVGNYIRLRNLWDYISQIGINPKDYDMVNKFVRSKELLDSPFVDVNASIWAAIGESYIQGRKSGEGDFYDVPILASALPYCDIVTTDKFMKEILINKLSFDEKYTARIFSATQSDRLEFQNLVRGLMGN